MSAFATHYTESLGGGSYFRHIPRQLESVWGDAFKCGGLAECLTNSDLGIAAGFWHGVAADSGQVLLIGMAVGCAGGTPVKNVRYRCGDIDTTGAAQLRGMADREKVIAEIESWFRLGR